MLKLVAVLLIWGVGKVVYKRMYPDYSLIELVRDYWDSATNAFGNFCLVASLPSFPRALIGVVIGALAVVIEFAMDMISDFERVFPVFLIPATPFIVETIYLQLFASLA